MNDRRSPDTIFLLALLLVAGVGQIVTGQESGTVEALVPGWMVTVWAGILTGGAGLALAGILWRDPVTGLFVEATGRVMLAPSSLAYALALAVAGGGSGALVASTILALAVASTWRVWQIHRSVRAIIGGLQVIAAHQADEAGRDDTGGAT